MKPTYYPFAFLMMLLLASSCSDSDDAAENPPVDDPGAALYFPPLTGTTWETVSMDELGWNESAIPSLLSLLQEKDTKAFIVLKNGKIAMEEYFGTFTRDSIWYWASAGKTLTAFTVGIAQEQGFLDINDRSSRHLGEGWTLASPEEENRITIWHQLTMTTGLNELFFDCVTPDCLRYRADAGSRWAYHNGPYTLLERVVSNATGSSYSAYFNAQLRDKIGMNGFWISTNGLNNVYFSNARSMARFGLLNLNNGYWQETPVLSDDNYKDAMRITSQDLNESYGYLWWLNGKESFMVPGSQVVSPGALIPNAPPTTYAGLGKNDQKLYLVPDQGIVVVRMGNDAGEAQAGPSSFDNELWGRLQALIGY